MKYLGINIDKITPLQARYARNAVLVAIVCIMAAQGLVIHLLAFSLSANEEFNQGVIHTESTIAKTQQTWKQELQLILDYSNEKSNSEQKSSRPTSITIAFNLFVEKVGIDLPKPSYQSLSIENHFSYNNLYHHLHHQRIIHPPCFV
ncbi:hypothetical protein [Flectobacillus roseus]|uniref:hypothetical protein n=1 Tax=Flectobacillus roseus TaxID=502259 RepID=UPI0024B72EFA|nr:hypothetical protein [Flectobacillus roseus]MDI9867994.1 hypothetical protein [Flectobacillus roseus]